MNWKTLLLLVCVSFSARRVSAKCLVHIDVAVSHSGIVNFVYSDVSEGHGWLPYHYHVPFGDTLTVTIYYDPLCSEQFTCHTLNGDTISIENVGSSIFHLFEIGDHRITVASDPAYPATTDCTFTIAAPDADPITTSLGLRVFLGGALDTTGSAMRDDLRRAGLLPVIEPFTAIGFEMVGGVGTAFPAGAFDDQSFAGSNIVDWILVDIRDGNDPAILLMTIPCLLSVGGSAHVGTSLAPGDYYVSVRHRNHLGVMTANPVPFIGGNAFLDLASDSTPLFGANALDPGTHALWPGNAHVTSNPQRIKYIGANDDRDPILQRIGGTVPTASIVGYYNEDLNMDGIVKYVGANNDRDVVLQTIGGSIPTTVRVEQLP